MGRNSEREKTGQRNGIPEEWLKRTNFEMFMFDSEITFFF